MITSLEAARDWAFFLDLDGTLVPIAAHPDSARPPARLKNILRQVAYATDGALALISGRPIRDIDDLTEYAGFAVAGLHGLELRTADGQQHGPSHDPQALAAARARLQSLAAAYPDLYLEDKQATLALHYRGATAKAAAAAADTTRSIIDESRGALARLAGKSVYEIKPSHGDKGDALRTLLASPPFIGKRPVYIGDDVTDEAGFVAANAAGGVSIRVGDLTGSAARYQLNTVAEVLEWLETTAAALSRANAPST